MLPIVLHSLAVQTFEDFEVIVTDNSDSQKSNHRLVYSLDSRFRHVDTQSLGLGGCYATANWAVENECQGEFVCFPSDDSYYMPVFAERMLKPSADLVYCNMVYDARFTGLHYATIDVQPVLNSIDKTGFIVRRSKFQPFNISEKADGELIELLISQGISHAKIPDVLMVHN
jgi:glycosyltransferase involved in cell wall biosynthesis